MAELKEREGWRRRRRLRRSSLTLLRVQGGAGQFIRHIDGSYTGVMGLPLFETAQLLRQGGLLVSLLILPLYVPVMIFGVLASSGAQSGIDNTGAALTILLAIVLTALVVTPFASAAALRSYMR